MKIENYKLEQLKKIIQNSETIALAAHIRPDGDALGSVLSFSAALKQLDKSVVPIKNSEIGQYLNFLPNLDLLTEDYIDEKVDLFIVLDCSELDRIADAKVVFEKAKNTVVIDHHVKGNIKGDLNIIDENASSTCQLVYEIIKYLNLEFTNDISSLLFTGIVTDTGRFMFDNVDFNTHLIAADLLKNGANQQYIFNKLYQNKKIEQLQMESYILQKTKYYNDKIAFVYISDEDVNKFNLELSDTDSIVNILRDLEPVEVSIVMKKYSDDEYKISMRSKNFIDVSEIARSNGGGGHIRAAGFSIYANKEEAFKKIEKIIEEIK
ncbi:MAG: bifunctional oligoribonuclease/PAP phosphatase NrnA [Tissierellia bacterium]|nr:bifunctional oligoribonuclease/PAP phosphatase NrnA [Tissierellia bacterium]